MRMPEAMDQHHRGDERPNFGTDGEPRGTLLGVIEMIGSPESVAQAREFTKRKLGADHLALADVTLLVHAVSR
ncbi:hypothetical protein Sme01_33090 [Sphaerisporangium melleum]|uniref:Uncharacterized protein n=1 Tax=Sphaerisporangium melleum TaxID=321316 RepID=A0A917QXM3_9ACTN|nr:hypothetical protein [Sphaerisporangium melleum]GGK73813.1 hypothetical protein GCM10007964_15750 [Sphaerisporangium melleum]GII70833.1 hypothetical protein Sme01_33090 [Sphaerisporangium melleum]